HTHTHTHKHTQNEGVDKPQNSEPQVSPFHSITSIRQAGCTLISTPTFPSHILLPLCSFLSVWSYQHPPPLLSFSSPFAGFCVCVRALCVCVGLPCVCV